MFALRNQCVVGEVAAARAASAVDLGICFRRAAGASPGRRDQLHLLRRAERAECRLPTRGWVGLAGRAPAWDLALDKGATGRNVPLNVEISAQEGSKTTQDGGRHCSRQL